MPTVHAKQLTPTRFVSCLMVNECAKTKLPRRYVTATLTELIDWRVLAQLGMEDNDVIDAVLQQTVRSSDIYIVHDRTVFY